MGLSIVDMEVVAELPMCAGCGRVLTGKVGVALCSCWDCYCEVCLADWDRRYCQKCRGEVPRRNEPAREIVSGLYETWGAIVAEESTVEEKVERLRGARETLKQAFIEAFATTQVTYPPTLPAFSTTHPPTFPSLPAFPTTQLTYPPTLPALPAQSSLQFPPILQDFRQSQCEYCSARLSPNPAGRCFSCKKVNMRTVQFNREKFLCSKWECPHCKLRNVHSNQKCIECGSMKEGIGRRW